MNPFTAADWDSHVNYARRGRMLDPVIRGQMLEFASHQMRENFTSAADVVVLDRDVLEAMMLVSAEGSTDAVVKGLVDLFVQAGDEEAVVKTASKVGDLTRKIGNLPHAGGTVDKPGVLKGVLDGLREEFGKLSPVTEMAVRSNTKKALMQAFPSHDSLSGLALTPYREAVGEYLLVADRSPAWAFKASIVDIQGDTVTVLDRSNLSLRTFTH